MITEQDYINAEDQFINLTNKELVQLAKKAADAQPALFVFIAACYDSLGKDENKEFYIQSIYSTWIAYNNKYKLKRKLNIEEIEKTEEKLSNDIYKNEDALIDEALKRMTEHPQAALAEHLRMQIDDFFGPDQLQDENSKKSSYPDAGIISGVINSFINLLEKTRETLVVS